MLYLLKKITELKRMRLYHKDSLEFLRAVIYIMQNRIILFGECISLYVLPVRYAILSDISISHNNRGAENLTSNKDFKYSVLMGLYHKDSPEFLRIAIDSMLNQTIPPEEYFIAVDGPIGEELQGVLNDYRGRYGDLFTIYYHPENRGVGAILGEVLPLCRNEFIARMDADDYSVPERIEKELAIFEAHPEYDWVGSNVDEFFDDMEHPVSHVIMPETTEEILKFARRRCPFRQPTLLMKKSAVIAAGGYKNVYRYEDYELIVRMLRKMTMGGGGIQHSAAACAC